MSEEVKNMNETKPETATKETAAPVETMADYEDAINASLKPIHEGDILTGEVIGVSEDTSKRFRSDRPSLRLSSAATMAKDTSFFL